MAPEWLWVSRGNQGLEARITYEDAESVEILFRRAGSDMDGMCAGLSKGMFDAMYRHKGQQA